MKILLKLLFFCCLFIIIFSKLIIYKSQVNNHDNLLDYCNTNGFSTKYCIIVDFSKPSGLNRFYIYDFEKREIIHKSLCSNGRGKENNPFCTTFSNQPNSNYSSLGKYRLGNLRKMTDPDFGEGFVVYGLENTNSNAFSRGIMIHKGNPNFEIFPFPGLLVSKGCFAVSASMIKHIKIIKKETNKPILIYAFK